MTSDSQPAVALARALLFVPGDRDDRFAKAAAAGADLVVCDLEDAVSPTAKDTARDAVADWLAGAGRAAVRVNAVGTQWYAADCAALSGLPGLAAVIVPKAEDAGALAELSDRLGGTPLVPLVETALGLHRALEIAAVPGVARLAFGALDFALDAGTADDDEALLFARSSLVVVSRVAGLSQPVDGVTVELDRPEQAGQDAARARRLGFGGKLCIHPRQVEAVNAAFTPTAAEVQRARRIVAAAETAPDAQDAPDASARGGSGGGGRPGGPRDSAPGAAVARLDGIMVDAPVLERARRVLAQADLGHDAATGQA